nr:MAG TPA: hypothetical protein [Caudoviricetes sp.]
MRLIHRVQPHAFDKPHHLAWGYSSASRKTI